MNSPNLLISPTASAAGAVAAPGAESPADEGFASALASSIAGIAQRAQSAPDEALPQVTVEEEEATLADVMQWLGLPSTPALPADTQVSGEPGLSAEQSPGDAQQQILAVTAKTAARHADASSATQDSEPSAEGDALALLAEVPVPEDSSAKLASSVASVPGAGSGNPAALQIPPQVQPLAALATALVRDGAASNGAAAGTAVHASLREPVGSARWAEELGSRMVLMSVRGQQEGSLTLMPEHLGPLEVQISVSKDTANVWFGAQHADTRAALTEALPRLRELLAASGLSLGQAGVSDQAPRRSSSDLPTDRTASAAASDGIAPAEAAEPVWRPLRSTLIDTYA